MDQMAEFVARKNIDNFAGRLEIELDAEVQQVLRRLLLEEERRYARLTSVLWLVERHISENGACIARQQEIVATFNARSWDCSIASQLLESLTRTRDLLVDYRREVLSVMDRNGF
jgi:hypothetical protein